MKTASILASGVYLLFFAAALVAMGATPWSDTPPPPVDEFADR